MSCACAIPGVPVFVLGESMGGAVAMTAFASDTPPRADGLILVAPAVWGRQTMPFSYRLALWTTAHTLRLDLVLRLGAQDHAERQHRDAARERQRSAVPQERAHRCHLRLGTLMDEAYAVGTASQG